MHASAAPSTTAGPFAPEFCHHFTAWNTFRQGMPVPAMCAVDKVIPIKRSAYADSDGLFTDVQVHKARQHPGPVQLLYFQLEIAQL
jgi:hypothetical protein